MSIFKLPDLGEGLPDAEINEWHIKEGDVVKTDQPLVSMETAKAVVDVPSPQDGKIIKLYGQAGDIIITGAPLIEFESATKTETIAEDSGTVVGNIESTGQTVKEDFIIGKQQKKAATGRVKATPAVRALAKKLGVDLADVTPSGANGIVTKQDIEQAGQQTGGSAAATNAAGGEPLRGVRRHMATAMAQSHAEVVPVTLFDDADIHAWAKGSDITARLIQAVIAACLAEPALNALYDGKAMTRYPQADVNLGLAMDTPDGLFVPVIKAAQKKDAAGLRESINTYKQTVRSREVPQDDLKGASITLSNFGNFAGRYASPIVVPPTVAIIGVGKLREDVVADNGKPAVHRIVPLSLTFDHRAVTGGEATRFLGTMIEHLQQA